MRLCLFLVAVASAWPLSNDIEAITEETTITPSSSSPSSSPSSSSSSASTTTVEPILSTTEISETTTTSSTTSNRVVDYFEQKFQINEMAGVSCEVCLKAVYGINYNVIRLKKAAEDMVRKDCEALFDGNGEYISRCIRVMVEKIEHYYDKVEPVIDTRNLCVKMRMCAPQKLKEIL